MITPPSIEVAFDTSGASSSVLTMLLTYCIEALREKQPITTQDHGSKPGYYMYQDHDDTSVADDLANRVRVLCWVMTQPSNHAKKAQHVKATWGKRCNKLLFMSSAEDPELPAIQLPGVREGRRYLWSKTKEAFRYVYQYHRDDADWFLKADDDTYVVVENLRLMLSRHSSKDPLYVGCRFRSFNPQGYMDGGAGYVLSAEALDRFVTLGLPAPDLCEWDDADHPDVKMGACLENIGVKAVDSRDDSGRDRFFPHLPQARLKPNRDGLRHYWKKIYYPSEKGLACCSDHAVSFHGVDPKHMYVFDYLIYHLRPYGINLLWHRRKSTFEG